MQQLSNEWKESLVRIHNEVEKEERKAARKKEREELKKAKQIEAEKNQKPVKRIDIVLEWKKSRTWGMCPKAEARATFADNTCEYFEGRTVTGCGYDKQSTAVAEVLNHFLKYKLWAENERIQKENIKHDSLPYGATFISQYNYVGFSGGVGVNCYYRVAEFMGDKFTTNFSTNSVDNYSYIVGGAGIEE